MKKMFSVRLPCGVCLTAAGLMWGANLWAATYAVGPTRSCQTVSSLPALAPGDVVEIDSGAYHEVKRWTSSGTPDQPIIIRGVGDSRPIFDAAGQTVDGVLPRPRAIFQMEAHYLTLENLEFRNARNGDNGAGIRVTSANNVIVRNCRITGCDMGLMCDNNRNLLIESSEIASNGTALYNGYSHNLYLGGVSTTLRFCYIHDALYGQNVKSRAHYTELLYNYIADSQDGEVGLVDASETTSPHSHAAMVGNIVISKPRLSGYNSGRFIQFGQDSGGQHNGTLQAFNNTFMAGDGRIQFLSANASGAAIAAHNNIFYGSDKIVGTAGGGVSGSNNWMQSSAAVPGTFYTTTPGTDPGFVDRLTRDLRLTAASACRNQGRNALTFLDGAGAAQSGRPGFEYVNHRQKRPRPRDDRLDLGAYEFGVPRLTGIQLKGNDCVIDFTTVSGYQYEVQRASGLPGNIWLPVAHNIPGLDGIQSILDIDAASQPSRFYRVAYR